MNLWERHMWRDSAVTCVNNDHRWNRSAPAPRQGPRLSIRIDIWILPSDTVYYSRIGRRQCYLPAPRTRTYNYNWIGGGRCSWFRWCSCNIASAVSSPLGADCSHFLCYGTLGLDLKGALLTDGWWSKQLVKSEIQRGRNLLLQQSDKDFTVGDTKDDVSRKPRKV